MHFNSNILPEDWQKVTLEDIVTYAIGGDWGKKENYEHADYQKVYCIRGSEFKNWKQNKGNTAVIRKVKKTSLDKRKLRRGDILVEISGGGPEQPVGRTVVIDNKTLNFDNNIPKIFTNFLRLIRITDNIYPFFLQFFFQYFYRSGQIIKYQGGSNNLRNLKFKDFLTIKPPLPPLPEQHEIVRRIEAMFSELDNSIESLKKAQQQLKTYRQSVLKHAFEGKLTEKWREQCRDAINRVSTINRVSDSEPAEELLKKIKAERQRRYEEQLREWEKAVKKWEADGKPGKKPQKPQKPKELPELTEDELKELPELPEEWRWMRLGNMTLKVEYGSSKKSLPVGKVPVLRMGNIQNGYFDWSDLVYSKDEEEIKKYLLEKDDVLFNRTNSPELVGKTAMFRGERNAIFAGYLIRINHFKNLINSKYLNYFLNSHTAKKHGNSVKTDGVNQSNINGEKLMKYPFPLTNLQEQHQIVQEIEQRLSVADNLEKSIEESLQKAEALRQSILKQAFEGRLTEAWRKKHPELVTGENSAERLLERIKEEKESLSQKTIKKS
ncbi:MAG: restriction endonuclease subunit S [Bacteroidota bacterium]